MCSLDGLSFFWSSNDESLGLPMDPPEAFPGLSYEDVRISTGFSGDKRWMFCYSERSDAVRLNLKFYSFCVVPSYAFFCLIFTPTSRFSVLISNEYTLTYVYNMLEGNGPITSIPSWHQMVADSLV